jgi:ribosomal protein L11 methylase PrmA
VNQCTVALVRCLLAGGIHHREIRRSQPYDLVFANILAGPLVALAPDLSSVVSRRGRLILAGLTRTRPAGHRRLPCAGHDRDSKTRP